MKRSRTQDPVDDREYIGDCSKRTKREKDYSGHMDSFEGDLSDGDDIDCSTLVLTRVKRIDALHIWDLLDDAKRQEDVVKNETSNSSEIDAMAEEIPDGNSNSQEISVDDSDGDKEVSGGDNNDGEEEAGAAIQKANNELYVDFISFQTSMLIYSLQGGYLQPRRRMVLVSRLLGWLIKGL